VHKTREGALKNSTQNPLYVQKTEEQQRPYKFLSYNTYYL